MSTQWIHEQSVESVRVNHVLRLEPTPRDIDRANANWTTLFSEHAE